MFDSLACTFMHHKRKMLHSCRCISDYWLKIFPLPNRCWHWWHILYMLVSITWHKMRSNLFDSTYLGWNKTMQCSSKIWLPYILQLGGARLTILRVWRLPLYWLLPALRETLVYKTVCKLGYILGAIGTTEIVWALECGIEFGIRVWRHSTGSSGVRH